MTLLLTFVIQDASKYESNKIKIQEFKKFSSPLTTIKTASTQCLSLDEGFTGVLFGDKADKCFKNVHGTDSKLHLYRKITLKSLGFYFIFGNYPQIHCTYTVKAVSNA